MKFVKIADRNEIVEFLAFNYDGKGGALVKFDDSQTVHHYDLPDVQNIIIGRIGKESEYELL